MAATARVITLYGDPRREPESAEHIINFPGGHVAVMRTSDGSYWAHITREREEHAPGEAGVFIDSRVDVEGKHASETNTPEAKGALGDPNVYHVAIRIGRAVQS